MELSPRRPSPWLVLPAAPAAAPAPTRLPSPNDWRSSSASMPSVGAISVVRVALAVDVARRRREPSERLGATAAVRFRPTDAGSPAAGTAPSCGGGAPDVRGRGITGSSSAVASPPARSPPPRARRSDLVADLRRAGRTDPARAWRVGALPSASAGPRRVAPAVAASRIASIRSALRMRVGAFTPTAPAIVWSSSRSLPSSIERSSSVLRIDSLPLGRSGPLRAVVTAEVGHGVGSRQIGGANRGYGDARLNRGSRPGMRRDRPGRRHVTGARRLGNTPGTPVREQARHEVVGDDRRRSATPRSVYSPPGARLVESRRGDTAPGPTCGYAPRTAWRGRAAAAPGTPRRRGPATSGPMISASHRSSERPSRRPRSGGRLRRSLRRAGGRGHGRRARRARRRAAPA